MKKILVFMWLIVLALRMSAQNIVLAEYRSNNNPMTGQSGAAGAYGVAATGVTRGPGVSFAGGSDYSAQNWTTGYFYHPSDYFQVTISPIQGFKLSLSHLQFNFVRNTSGPSRIEVRTSKDNYATTIYSDNAIGTGNNSTGFSLGSSFQNLTSTLTIRVYGCRASSSTGTLRVSAYSGYTKQLLPNGALAGVIIRGTRTQGNTPEDGGDPGPLVAHNEKINLFPNPSSGIVNIEAEMGAAPTTLSALNLLGQVVYTKTFEIGVLNEQVDLTGQPQGVYCLRFETSGRVLTRKLILKANEAP